MKYGEAFSRLGYKLDAPRTDWSAKNASGVCISIWRTNVDWSKSPLTMDTRTHESKLDAWSKKAGNKKRQKHIQHALDEYDGWIDVVIVDGNSTEGVEKASPWNLADRKGFKWRIIDFEPNTGHVSLRAFPPSC